jgi:site-specific recombinase XerD
MNRKEGFCMSDLIFSSSLAPYMNEFMRSLVSRGLKATVTRDNLRQFDLFLSSKAYNKPFLDREIYDMWIDMKRMNCKPYTVYQQAATVRSLSLFMNHLGNESYVPRLPQRNFNKCVSYTFSINEMERIFDACDTLEHKIKKASSTLMVIPVLIRLLYSTGMRIREALSIRNKDVDFKKHLITLGNTKNGNQRLAALKPSMENVLKQYILYRSKLPVKNTVAPESFLFINGLGKKISYVSVYEAFQKTLQKADINDTRNYLGPRIHALRHTACQHAFIRLAKNGEDLYCNLHKITVFMGHKHVNDTEYYLRLTEEQYPELFGKVVGITGAISGIMEKGLRNDDNKNPEEGKGGYYESQ